MTSSEGPGPAFPVPPHLVSPSRELAAWFTAPPGAVIQVARRTQLTLDMATWLSGDGVVALDRRFPHGEPLVLVLDLTLMTGRDPAVRPVLVGAARALSSRMARAFVIPPDKASPVYLASLRAAASLLRVFGVEVQVSPTLARSLGEATLTVGGR